MAKKIQWTFPEFLGEDRFAVLLGGLHIEMILLSTLGDLMVKSGWSWSFKDAEIVNSLAAGLCLLKGVNVKRSKVRTSSHHCGIGHIKEEKPSPNVEHLYL